MRFGCIFLLLLLLASCQKDNAPGCFKASGKAGSETRALGTFHALRLNSKMDLEIVQGPDCNITFSCGQHLMSKLSATISQDTLLITNHNSCNVVRGYKKGIHVRVTVPQLTALVNNSVGSITVTGMVQDSLFVKTESSGDVHADGTFRWLRSVSSGNGDIYLSGSTRELIAFANGTNYLHANDLAVSEYLQVETMTLGDCYLNANGLKRMDYAIRKKGHIYYKGHPSQINNVGGNGAPAAENID